MIESLSRQSTMPARERAEPQAVKRGPPSRPRHRRLAPVEDLILVLGAFLATLHAEWRIVANSSTFQADAPIHEYWMRRFQDSGLFGDPLTDALLSTGYSPPAFRSLYWLASHVIDPVFFGEILPLVLQPLAVWLLFRIVRAHVEWWPAAWIGATLFLLPWDIHRFSGGHPRAFAQPIVLLTVLLLLHRRTRAAAVVPAIGLLLYPPAGIVALGIVCLAVLARGRRFLLDPERAVGAVISLVGVGVALLVTRVTTGSQDAISEAQAHRFPEFGPNGQMHFFAADTLDYLRQNYSGFFLQDSGSLLAVAAVLLLVARPRNVRLLRWEVWSMAVAAIVLFGVAHALLFRLYLPHRYTYPLLPFFCIVIAVALRPTLDALRGRKWTTVAIAAAFTPAVALAALTAFPLGPRLSLSKFASWLADARLYIIVGLAVAALLVAVIWVEQSRYRLVPAAALSVGVLLGATVAFAGGLRSPGALACRNETLYEHLRTLPKGTVIAADPFVANCVPIAARRAVVISRKLYQPWAVDYFRVIRERTFDTVEAYYGSSVDAVVKLRERYGADYLLVRKNVRRLPWTRMQPFTGEVRRLRESVDVAAIQKLSARCVSWREGPLELYDLRCIAAGEAR